MKKKLLLVLITAILVLSAFVLVGCGDGTIPATEGLEYEKIDDKNEYMLSSIGSASTPNIVIASTYNGMPVTAIGECAFSGCSNLESITIPNSVTSIGNFAFDNCSSLKSITIPNSVTSIGEFAFSDCNSLVKVNYIGTIDDWVQIEFLYSPMFGGFSANPLCYARNLYVNGMLVTNANITSANKINAYAFYGCSSLESVTIGNSVTSIGQWAFTFCDSLTSITIPDSLASIEARAFYNCGELTSVKIGNGVTSIGNHAFADCTSLTIYCEATSKPSGWDSNWNSSNRPVVWDYKNN